MTVPHRFPSLISGDRLPIIFLGSGMSHGLAPMVDDLIKLCPEAEKRLGIEVNIDLNENEKFHVWAEEVISHLERNGDALPRLTLAKSLGLLNNAKMLGNLHIPLSKIPPRHRVLARFAREERWKAIWTFNWDTWLEVALENVGIERDSANKRYLPWPTSFHTFITEEDYPHIVEEHIIVIYKPHGCIEALREAELQARNGDIFNAKRLSDRFMITKSDFEHWIDRPTAPDESFGSLLSTQLPSRPVILVGWSFSEEYFYNLLRDSKGKIKPELTKNHVDDPISIIDPEFKLTHNSLVNLYEVDESSSHFKVLSGAHGYSTDDLFLWIQARHALAIIRQYCEENEEIINDIDRVLNGQLSSPNSKQPIVNYVDEFLPAWCRICWREGLVEYNYHGSPIPPQKIPLSPRDVHIPYGTQGSSRPDLQAAGRLLSTLMKSTKTWVFEKYPGGLFDNLEAMVVIPIPAWESNAMENTLAGLKALMDIIAENRGYIRSIKILPLMHNSNVPPQERIQVLKEQVARQSQISEFANSNNIVSLNLSDI